ncbi:serine--tRNA ligase [Candidatus Microgenomates bacterium]|nr:MAG: serine--tRNA ligase [Candidatus Microgenomates bacterium]
MLDIKFIRDNLALVKESLKKRCSTVRPEDLLDLDAKRVSLIQKIEALRKERNELSRQLSAISRQRGKEIKEELKLLEPELAAFETELRNALSEVPNIVLSQVPVGKSEQDNKVLKHVGEQPHFSFTPLDHLALAEKHDLLDFERGAKVVGSQFYYVKNDLVLLEQALVQFAFTFLVKKGFIPVATPDVAKSRYYLGTGYNPKGPEAQTYTLEGEDLGLIATAEVTLAGLHADEILDSKQLPIKYVGISHCFRKEAGAYGRYSKGLYRVHQFTKVEMFVFCLPGQSEKMHEELLEIETEFYKNLEIPFRVVEMCSADLGAQAARKFDLEAWMPGRGDFGEITSTSNTTDYQARQLNIKYRPGHGQTAFVHTLNGTVLTSSRTPIALLENMQEEDGTIRIPKVLQKYFGKKKIGEK